jgi:hypothetical protein
MVFLTVQAPPFAFVSRARQRKMLRVKGVTKTLIATKRGKLF